MGEDDEQGIEEEIIKKLMELRSYLEARIRQLEEETEKLKSLFQIMEEVIVTRSFQRAEVIRVAQPKATQATTPSTLQATPSGEEIPLKTSNGLLLANIYVTENEARIIPVEKMTFTTTTSPFQAFFIRRILEPMQAKDQEDAKAGVITPDNTLSYDILTDGDIIKVIAIKNYGDQRRLREIITSSRWTLEKMHEKAKTAT